MSDEAIAAGLPRSDQLARAKEQAEKFAALLRPVVGNRRRGIQKRSF